MTVVAITAQAKPRGDRGAPAVQISVAWYGGEFDLMVSLGDAERGMDAIGAAVGALKLGASYVAGTDPRNVERLYRARLAIRLGVAAHDVRTVFDLTEAAYAALVAEVGK